MNANQVSRKLAAEGFRRMTWSRGARKGKQTTAGGFEVREAWQGGIALSVKPIASTTFEAVCEVIESLGFVKVTQDGRTARFEIASK